MNTKITELRKLMAEEIEKDGLVRNKVLPKAAITSLPALLDCAEALLNCEAMMVAIECGHQKPIGFGHCLDEAREALANLEKAGQ